MLITLCVLAGGLWVQRIVHYSTILFECVYGGDIVMWLLYSCLQVSALELDIIEVDPETKEMLKTLVRWCFAVIHLNH